MPARIPDSLIEDMRETLRREALHKKLNTLAHSMQIRSLEKAASYELGSARANEEAEKLEKLVANAREEWKRGYNNDWMSSTYSMLIMIEQVTAYLEACNFRGMAVDLLDNTFGISQAFYKALDEYTYKNPPEKALPKLQYHVDVVDGKLNFDSLKDMTRSDGKPMFPTLDDPNLAAGENLTAQQAIDALRGELELRLETGLTVWLAERGYEAQAPQTPPGANSKIFVKNDGSNEKLTQEKFDELRISADHPERSLDAFLKGEFQMDFQRSATPRRSS